MASEQTFRYYDEKHGTVKTIKAKDLTEKIEPVKAWLKKCTSELTESGEYRLDEIQATLSIEGGYLVFKATGSVKLTYKRKSPT